MTMRRREDLPAAPDAGFTLVEVVVSLALITVIATAALAFFVQGLRTAKHQTQSLSATAVATDAMERAFSVPPQYVAGVSGLVRGRTQAAVQASWTAGGALGVQGLTQTYPSWDPAATASSTPALALTVTGAATTLDGEAYTVRTLVGTCYRPLGNADAACTTLAGQASDPGTVPAGYSRLLRVMVVVTWVPVDGSCTAAAPCQYQTSSLVDANADLAWNNITRPIASDDEASVDVGGNVTLDVLANDLIGSVTTNPVQNVTMTAGSATAVVQTDARVKFTAPANASGAMSFTYSLRDRAGRTSNTATVRVAVKPKAVDDSATTVQGTPVTVPVTGNDRGSIASVQVLSQPAGGSAVANGTSVQVTPPGTTGTITFTYTVTDTSGLVSAPATVTVVVSPYPAPKSQNLTIQVPAGSTAFDLTLAARTANPDGYLFHVLSTTIAMGQLHVAGANYNAADNNTGAVLGFTPQTNTVGTYTFTYRTETPDKATASAQATVTLQVVPVPVADAVTVAPGAAVKINVGANDMPMNYGGVVQIGTISTTGTSCGTVPGSQPDLQNGLIAFTAGASAGSCSFTYTEKGTNGNSGLESAPVTVTVTVSP